ncbi:response regulator transcription factor [Spirosoma koreense]
MTILIADDHTIVRLGLELHLSDILPEAEVLLSQSFPEVLDILQQHAIDLIVLDVDMPGSENSKMIEKIRRLRPEVLILIYSGMDEQLYALPYIKAGADGYLSKNAPFSELTEAITALSEHGKYVSRVVQQQMLHSLGQAEPNLSGNPFQSLSQRERTVLNLLLEGKGTKLIANTLQLEQSTVSTYKKQVFEKFDVTSTAELIQKVAFYKHI